MWISLSEKIKDILSKVNDSYSLVKNDYITSIITTRIKQLLTDTNGSGILYESIRSSYFTNLPPKLGYGTETTVTISYNASNTSITIASIPIYLGGYFSILPNTTVKINTSSGVLNHYIYLSRNIQDFSKVDILIYNNPISITTTSQGINFSKILVANVITNKTALSSIQYYHTNYYK